MSVFSPPPPGISCTCVVPCGEPLSFFFFERLIRTKVSKGPFLLQRAHLWMTGRWTPSQVTGLESRCLSSVQAMKHMPKGRTAGLGSANPL
ncbi:unnamed protein product [Periconia digitata]|uniref:Uncharacterized protein n=1 Tax=Periconia digitata TaxID=1303443 RepID=A0A9W4UCV1_9PLEO|nr:unnamed protein product [Periconia digitata]